MTAPCVIGISGGSGSGKTTLADDLKALRPQETLLLHLDDYAFPRETLPKTCGATNFDHPDAIDYKRLIRDLRALKAYQDIATTVRVPRTREPNDPPRKRVAVKLHPAPLIIVEGFLLLHYPSVRSELDISFFLASDIEQTAKRRANQAENEEWYLENIMKPMHREYVAPSSKHATYTIDVAQMSSDEVSRAVENLLKRHEHCD